MGVENYRGRLYNDTGKRLCGFGKTKWHREKQCERIQGKDKRASLLRKSWPKAV